MSDHALEGSGNSDVFVPCAWSLRTHISLSSCLKSSYLFHTYRTFTSQTGISTAWGQMCLCSIIWWDTTTADPDQWLLCESAATGESQNGAKKIPSPAFTGVIILTCGRMWATGHLRWCRYTVGGEGGNARQNLIKALTRNNELGSQQRKMGLESCEVVKIQTSHQLVKTCRGSFLVLQIQSLPPPLPLVSVMACCPYLLILTI